MDISVAKIIATEYASSFPNYDLNAEYIGELGGGAVFFFKSLVNGKHVGLPFYCLVVDGKASRIEGPMLFQAMKLRRSCRK